MTVARLNSQNNLVSKLAGTTWRASASNSMHQLWPSPTQSQNTAAQSGQNPVTSLMHTQLHSIMNLPATHFSSLATSSC